MSQLVMSGCCWCNCGLNFGLHCSALFCSCWCLQPETMLANNQQDFSCMDRNNQSLGCNLLCIGVVMCAPQAIQRWSRKLISPPDSSIKDHNNSRDSFHFEGSSIVRSWQKGELEPNQFQCTICLSSHPEFELQCGHRFHRQCIMKWMSCSQVCPVCRSHLIEQCKLFCSGCGKKYCRTAIKYEKFWEDSKDNMCSQCLYSQIHNDS